MLQEAVEIHGDVLETVFSRVPLVYLPSAAAVSKTWSDAVMSSLRYWNKPRPWLIIHVQATRPPYSATTRAYDPRSKLWIKVSRPPIDYASDLRSSHSSFLYMLSPARLAFSSDPLNLDWHELDPPAVWRMDPIVACVGDCVIVAGGGCDFEDDPLAVEMYDLKTRERRNCDSMPVRLQDSAGCNSLSVAGVANRLIVTHKESGLTHCLDPETKSWSGPFHLDLRESVSRYMIGCTTQGLILVGLCRLHDGEGLKVWRLNSENFSCVEEMGEMPSEYVEKLRSGMFGFSSLNSTAAGNTVFLYNDTCDVEEVVACEIEEQGGCRWWSVRHVVAREEMIARRMVYTSSAVGLEEVRAIVGPGNLTLEPLIS